MTRKDTILIGVIVNASLLAILFMTAFIYDSGGDNTKNYELSPKIQPIEVSAVVSSKPAEPPKIIAEEPPKPILVVEQPIEYLPEIIAVQANAPEDEPAMTQIVVDQGNVVDVVVKRGDSLDKIAREYGTTSGTLKKFNQLQSNTLSIGQVIKVPSKRESASPLAQNKPAVAAPEKKAVSANEPTYYIVKSGDSPWKISRQTGTSVDEILRLNQMDEAKARNLKVGDRIRVK